MEQHRNPAQFVRDLTHDLSSDLGPRAARASKKSIRTRLNRLRSRLYFILQCSIGAGVSWWLAQTIFGHPAPYLAPITAIICLGLSFGQRWRRALEVTAGVATGVFIGSAFAHYFGSGAWQIIVVAAAGMTAASLLGGGALISTQAAVQGIVVLTFVGHPESGFSRWVDALVGAAVALLGATIAPVSPIDKPRDIANRIGTAMSEVLREAIAAYRAHDLARATQALYDARASESELEKFAAATNEGLAVVRHSPLLRKHRGDVLEIAAVAAPLDRAVRNIRVLVRRFNSAIWRQQRLEPELIRLVEQVADLLHGMSQADEPVGRPAHWRDRLVRLADSTNEIEMQSLSAAVIISQVRSIVVDLLEVTGLTYQEARELLTPYPDDPDQAV